MTEPWDLTESQRIQFREAQIAAKQAASVPCGECGCLPGNPWYCGCSNELCPCFSDDSGDDDDE